MADASIVGYNPSDPLQQGFLKALALGESGGGAFSSTQSLGVGGVDLSGATTDQYGFPLWHGTGNSHAAGTFQFQPGTWDALASQYGLNFMNSSDQSQGAWLLAEQTYSQNTGGASLETALQTGKFSSVQAALASIWPSVKGNQANPTGLANALASSTGAAPNNQGDAQAASQSGGGLASLPIVGGLIGGAENIIARGGVLLVGIIVIAAALWALLAQQGLAPTPKQIVSKI